MFSCFDRAVVTAISPMVLMVVRNIEVSGSIPSTIADASTGRPKETMIEVRQTKEPPGTPGAPMERATTVTKSAPIKAGVIPDLLVACFVHLDGYDILPVAVGVGKHLLF